jgi:hypothetical protein
MVQAGFTTVEKGEFLIPWPANSAEGIALCFYGRQNLVIKFK